MFLAVIVPPAKENKILAGVILISMAGSFMFTKLPMISALSSGTRTILLTILIAGGAAVLFPVKSEENAASNTEPSPVYEKNILKKEIIHET